MELVRLKNLVAIYKKGNKLPAGSSSALINSEHISSILLFSDGVSVDITLNNGDIFTITRDEFIKWGPNGSKN